MCNNDIDNMGSFDWQSNEETDVNPMLEEFGRVDYDIDVDNWYYERTEYQN